MALHYVDPAAVGANNGTSWADAWTSFASAIALAATAAGDIVYCRGTETNAAVFTCAQTGTNLGNIYFIGCDAAGTPRADQFVLIAGGGVANVMDLNGMDHLHFEYITFRGGTSHAVTSGVANVNACRFLHCLFENAGGCGLYTPSGDIFIMEECISRNNTSDGYYTRENRQLYHECSAYGNGRFGFSFTGSYITLLNCAGYENTDDNVYGGIPYWIICGCTFADSIGGSGIRMTAQGNGAAFFWNRLTGNDQYGIESPATDYRDYSNRNGTHGNGVGAISNFPNYEGNVALAAAGYVDDANDDYTLDDTAEQRRVEIELDWA